MPTVALPRTGRRGKFSRRSQADDLFNQSKAANGTFAVLMRTSERDLPAPLSVALTLSARSAFGAQIKWRSHDDDEAAAELLPPLYLK